jgi:hypothetical protein
VFIPEGTVLDVISHETEECYWRVQYGEHEFDLRYHDADIWSVDAVIAEVFKTFTKYEWAILLVAARLSLDDVDMTERIAEFLHLIPELVDDAHAKLCEWTKQDRLSEFFLE